MARSNSLFGRFNSLFRCVGNWHHKVLIWLLDSGPITAIKDLAERNSLYFPQLAGNSRHSETSSLETVSSSGESLRTLTGTRRAGGGFEGDRGDCGSRLTFNAERTGRRACSICFQVTGAATGK